MKRRVPPRDGIELARRRQAERALQDNQQRYRILAESSPDALFLCDRDGRLCYVNSAAAMFFQRTPAELVGLLQEDLFPPRRAARHKKAIQAVFDSGRPRFTPEPEKLPGMERWVDTRLAPIRNKAGRVVFVLGLARDITARVRAAQALRESEANFRAMAENAIDGTVIAVPPRRWVFVNRRMEELTGYTARELKRIDMMKLAPPAEAARVMNSFQRRLKGEDVPQRYETVLLRKDGTTLPVEVSATRTTWRGHTAVMAIVRNISAQKQVEEARRRLARRLIQIQERERVSIGAALHDHLGQLLTLARLEVGAIRPGDKASRGMQFKALQRIDAILAAVRDLAASLRPPILNDLDLETALAALASEFNAPPKLRVTFRPHGPSPRLSHEQKLCLYRIMQEALSNAIRHAHARRIETALETKGGAIQLTVRDDGRGFDPGAARAAGGIGLLGMHERMLICGGALEVQSAPGGGTTLVARMPARRRKRKTP